MATAPEAKDRPDTRSKASDRMRADTKIVRDMAAGTSRLREESKDYLPKYPEEEDSNYRRRIGRAVVPGFTSRSIKGLAGLVLREPVRVEKDVPEALVTLTEDIDNRGSHLDVFAKIVFEDALEAGHAGLLVDAPLIEEAESLTRGAERDLGVRPYLVHFTKESILSWRFTRERGRQILEQIVLHEPTVEPDGLFGEKEVDRYRVLMRKVTESVPVVTWQLWQKGEDNVPVQVKDGTVANVTEIPFVAVYGGDKTAELESDPPLLALAYTEIAHAQVESDLRESLHICSHPVPVFRGVDPDEKIPLGPHVGVKLPQADMDFVWREPSGTAHETSESRLEAYKHDASVLGLSMLFPETRQPETATARRMDKTEQDSALATAARSLQDALEAAFGFAAKMMKLDTGGSLIVNRDFDRLTLDSAQITAWLGAVGQGVLSLETFWQVLLEGGALPDDFDPEQELVRLERELLGAARGPEMEVVDEDVEAA